MTINLRRFVVGLVVLAFSWSAVRAAVTNAPPVAVAPAGPTLTVKSDHANAIYAANEKVTWTVDVVGDRTGLTALPYVVKNDGQVENGKGTLDLSTGPATVTASRADAGTLLLQIFPMVPNKGHRLGLGGAVVAPDEIVPSAPAPADFDDFWQGKLKELATVPVNPVLEKTDVSAEKNSEGLDYYKVTLDNVHGTHVRGQLVRPTQGEKFPAMLMVQYAGVYPLKKEWAIDQAKPGWLVLDISAHDIAIDESPDYYKNLQNTTLKNYTSIGDEDRETSYFVRMFLGCARALDYLRSRPDWDGKTLLVTGTSQGGLQSFVTAGLCPQVTAVAVNVPAGCDFLGPLAQPPHAGAWPYWLTGEPQKYDAKKVAATSGYFDGVNFAARIHCPTLIAVGLLDETARSTGVIAAYNVIKAPKQLVVMPFAIHTGRDSEEQKPYRVAFEQWKAALQAGKPVPPEGAK